MIYMNNQILNFVEQMEAKLLNDIVAGNELDYDLYDIAAELLENSDKEAYKNICQDRKQTGCGEFSRYLTQCRRTCYCKRRSRQ